MHIQVFWNVTIC